MKNCKILFLLGIIFFFGLTACSKKIVQTVSKPHFTYNISEVPNISLRQYIDTVINIKLNISVTQGLSDSVTLIPVTVPTGVNFVEPSGVGIPDFSWTFEMKARIDSYGTFPVSIRASSPLSDTEYVRFNIISVKNNNCVQEKSGIYTSTTTCDQNFPVVGGTDNNIRVTDSNNVLFVSAIPSFYNTTFTIAVDCATGNSYTAGNTNGGSFYSLRNIVSELDTANTIKMSYDVVDYPIVIGTCKTVLTR